MLAPEASYDYGPEAEPFPVNKLKRNELLRKAAMEALRAEIDWIRDDVREMSSLADQYERFAKTLAAAVRTSKS